MTIERPRTSSSKVRSDLAVQSAYRQRDRCNTAPAGLFLETAELRTRPASTGSPRRSASKGAPRRVAWSQRTVSRDAVPAAGGPPSPRAAAMPERSSQLEPSASRTSLAAADRVAEISELAAGAEQSSSACSEDLPHNAAPRCEPVGHIERLPSREGRSHSMPTRRKSSEAEVWRGGRCEVWVERPHQEMLPMQFRENARRVLEEIRSLGPFPPRSVASSMCKSVCAGGRTISGGGAGVAPGSEAVVGNAHIGFMGWSRIHLQKPW